MATILNPNGFYSFTSPVDMSFIEAGLTASNTRSIFQVDGGLKSYIPGRPINAVTAFTANKGYYVTTSVEPLTLPFDTGGSGGPLEYNDDFDI